MNQNPEEIIFNRIKELYPEMNDEELQIEFLVQVWVAAFDNKIRIYREGLDNGVSYIFCGAMIDPPDDFTGTQVKPEHYYDEVLNNILIAGVEKGYVHVVDVTGQGNYGFKNAHSIDMDDFFVHSMSRGDAIKFILDLVSEK